MCYPTAAAIVNLAADMANKTDLKPDSEVMIWHKGDVKIYLYRQGWNYSGRLRCDNIASGLPVVVPYGPVWIKSKIAYRVAMAWLSVVESRRYDRLSEAKQLQIGE